MSRRRWLGSLQETIDELGGGTIDVTNGGHLRIRLAAGGPTVYAAATPSDHRALHNVRGELRRASKKVNLDDHRRS